jgi:glycogen operon protein
MIFIKRSLRRVEDRLKQSFGVLKENGGYRFNVFAVGIEKITLTLNDIEYEMERHTSLLDTYTLFFDSITTPFTYVYNVFKRGDFFCDLIDPYATHTDITGTKSVYKEDTPFIFKNSKPEILPEKMVLYELNVRGFTKDPSSETTYPGTLEAVIEKLDYLKDLGINAIELMPIHLFNPSNQLWGYMTRSYMALSPHLSANNDPNLSLKKLVDAAHFRGISIILDVVFNHTDTMETTLYPFCDDFYLKNYDATGCGNTLNVTHPYLVELFLHAVHNLAENFQIDGLRFDLGLALCRNEKGEIMDAPPFIVELEKRYRHKLKIFYEPWDTAGYRLDHFPSSCGFLWDDRVRDFIRKFAKMDPDQLQLLPKIIHSPNKVKMVTCHDGFTLYDLVSYEKQHNLINGHKNKDGHHTNHSSNCGIEGPIDDPTILFKRLKRAESIFAALFIFSGPILINAGDEFLNTHYGNNNSYNQDNRISYLEWHKKLFPDFYNFTKKLIHIYLSSPLSNPKATIRFHGKDPQNLKFHSTDHLLAISKSDDEQTIYVAINSWKEPIDITLPVAENEWQILLHTSKNPLILEQNTILIAHTKNPL